MEALESVFSSEPVAVLRRRLFAELRRRGFFLSSGLKFGAHFLAYTGPLK